MNVNSWPTFPFYLLFLGAKIWYWCWSEAVMYAYPRCKSTMIGIYCGINISFSAINSEWVKQINNDNLPLKYEVLDIPNCDEISIFLYYLFVRIH